MSHSVSATQSLRQAEEGSRPNHAQINTPNDVRASFVRRGRGSGRRRLGSAVSRLGSLLRQVENRRCIGDARMQSPEAHAYTTNVGVCVCGCAGTLATSGPDTRHLRVSMGRNRSDEDQWGRTPRPCSHVSTLTAMRLPCLSASALTEMHATQRLTAALVERSPKVLFTLDTFAPEPVPEGMASGEGERKEVAGLPSPGPRRACSAAGAEGRRARR